MKLLPILALFPGVAFGACSEFKRGDVNCDGAVDLSDASYLANFLYQSGPPPCQWDAADANDDGMVDGSDIQTIANIFSGSGPVPACPYPESGFDCTADDLEPCCSPEEGNNVVAFDSLATAAGFSCTGFVAWDFTSPTSVGTAQSVLWENDKDCNHSDTCNGVTVGWLLDDNASFTEDELAADILSLLWVPGTTGQEVEVFLETTTECRDCSLSSPSENSLDTEAIPFVIIGPVGDSNPAKEREVQVATYTWPEAYCGEILLEKVGGTTGYDISDAVETAISGTGCTEWEFRALGYDTKATWERAPAIEDSSEEESVLMEIPMPFVIYSTDQCGCP